MRLFRMWVRIVRGRFGVEALPALIVGAAGLRRASDIAFHHVRIDQQPGVKTSILSAPISDGEGM